jgi:hypothetical protein
MIGFRPDTLFIEQCNNNQGYEALLGLGIRPELSPGTLSHTRLSNQIDPIRHECLAFNGLGPFIGDRAVFIILYFAPEVGDQVVRYAREIQIAMRIEQIRRNRFFTSGASSGNSSGN